MGTIIEFDHVWKRYLLGDLRRDVRSVLANFLSPGDLGKDQFWALRDVSFALEPGQSLGIIGKNGAGKTTILKLLARITVPTQGRITTKGRVAALINLGAGFHRELTGRENIFLNGVILGLSRREIARKFDSIVEFSGLEEFIDTPVKRYSSGMYARLGFSIATHVEPDILLIDEVLAVGDIGFRTKSYQKMLSFRDSGCAIVFVSHDMAAVTTMCNNTIWLDKGQVRVYGETDKVVKAYLDSYDQEVMAQSIEELRAEEVGSGEVIVERITIHNAAGEEQQDFYYGDDVIIQVHYRAFCRVDKPIFLVGVLGQYGSVFGANMVLDGLMPPYVDGTGVIQCTFHHIPLLPGTYRIGTQIKLDTFNDAFRMRIMNAFRVVSDMRDYGYQGDGALGRSRESDQVIVPYEWTLLDGSSRVHLGQVALNKEYPPRA
jgi:lipopolysaccharide transport system ATP-binding protein